MSYETASDVDFSVYDDLPKILTKKDIVEVDWRMFPRGAEKRLKARLESWGIEFGPKDGIWLAGGTLIRLMNNERLLDGDLDFLFKSRETQKEFVSDLMSGRPDISVSRQVGHLTELELIVTGLEADGLSEVEYDKLQVLTWQYPQSPRDIFDKMDFRLCHWAYDGEKVYASARALMDTRKKIVHPHRILFAKDSLRRAGDYVARGYSVHENLLYASVERLDTSYEKIVL